MHGKGVKSVLKSIARGAVRSTKWALQNLDSLVTLGKAGYDIYQGRKPEGVIDSIKRAKKRIGNEEQDAIKKLIGLKKKEIADKNASKSEKKEAKKELDLLEKARKADQVEDKLAKIPPPPPPRARVPPPPPPRRPKQPPPSQSDDLLSQIRNRQTTLRKVPARPSVQEPEPGSLQAIIQARRKQLEPENMEGGALAKKELLKLAMKNLNGGCQGGKGQCGKGHCGKGIPFKSVAGISSGLAKMVGQGVKKGKMCGTGMECLKGKGQKDLMNEIRSVMMKNMKNVDVKDLAMKIVKKLTGQEPKQLVDRVAEYIKTKL
jgi:hypothetical protein